MRLLIHGDAFERQIQPRPETVFSHEIALADTDRLAAGKLVYCAEPDRLTGHRRYPLAA